MDNLEDSLSESDSSCDESAPVFRFGLESEAED